MSFNKPSQKQDDQAAMDWNKLQKAFLHLYNTTRSFIELAEPVHNDECLVNTDSIDDLDAAYQEVNRLLSVERQDGVA